MNVYRLIIINILSIACAGFAVLVSVTTPLLSFAAFVTAVLLIHFGLSKSEPRLYASIGHIVFCVLIAGVAWYYENEAINQFNDQAFRERLINLGGKDAASTTFISIARTTAILSIYKYAAIIQAVGFSLQSFLLAKKRNKTDSR
jgi:hypothetical protein